MRSWVIRAVIRIDLESGGGELAIASFVCIVLLGNGYERGFRSLNSSNVALREAGDGLVLSSEGWGCSEDDESTQGLASRHRDWQSTSLDLTSDFLRLINVLRTS